MRSTTCEKLMVECTICTKSVDSSEAFHTETGLICQECNANIDLKAQLLKGTVNWAWGSWSTMLTSIFLFDLFGIVALFAGLTGLKFFKDLRTDDPLHQEALKGLKTRHKVIATIATVLGLLRFVLVLVRLGTQTGA